MSKSPKPILQDIKGKPYETVKSRTARFRHDHPDGCIRTTITHIDEKRVCCECTVLSSDGNPLGVDVAEEIFGSTYINETSAVENCSTSARGRALDAAGYNASDEVASYEEVAQAVTRQKASASKKPKPSPKSPEKPSDIVQELVGGGDFEEAKTIRKDPVASDGMVEIHAKFIDQKEKGDGSPYWALKDADGNRYHIWKEEVMEICTSQMDAGRPISVEVAPASGKFPPSIKSAKPGIPF